MAAAPTDSSLCEGRRITAIDVENAIRPVADGVQPAFIRPVVRAVLGGRRTQPGAIEPYVLLEPGSTCTNARRREGERLLRGLPYVASARLRAEPDGDGVRIVVEASDDLRPIVGMTLDDGSPESITLGTVNFRGTGNLVEGHWQDGGAFRHGFGFRASDPTILGRRAILGLSIDRQPIGDRVAISLVEPYLTRFQSIAWEISFRDETQYVPLDRNVADRSAWRTDWRTFNAGALARVSLGGIQLLGGGVFTHERITPADSATVITANGFQPVTDPALIARYAGQSGARAGTIVGLRALEFTPVEGLETVEGTHDMARGLQAAAVVGRGVSSGDDHPYLATEVYLGVGGGRSFANARVTAERRSSDAPSAARLVSGRVAWYWKVSERQTQEVSAEFSGIWREDVPAALFLDDRLTGPRGFDGAVASGSRLLVGRFERRFRVGGFGRAVGLGAAGFLDAAKLWAGDAPLGITTDPQFGVGLGFLVAVPRDSRKTIRLDAAYPLSQQADGVGGVEIRLAVTTAGRRYWREPAAFQRTRIVPMLRSLLGWF
ncbi:MAG TPA: hypothetical protein VFZ73_09100 [Gemmatimonadaceae bacterium]